MPGSSTFGDYGCPRTEVAREKKDIPISDGSCVFCGSALEEKIVSVPRSSFNFYRIGPRQEDEFMKLYERQQHKNEPMKKVDGFFCPQCGLRYEFIPGSHSVSSS